ncbi:hypothetical protein VTK73DRAFT_9894 [Phialemonium thermophilum]|uniref:Uncharacterized protein n=1 Tax=Phialemonium thermophilum TaxID=223376 RepID=A0ABR3VZL6_9PEZI
MNGRESRAGKIHGYHLSSPFSPQVPAHLSHFEHELAFLTSSILSQNSHAHNNIGSAGTVHLFPFCVLAESHCSSFLVHVPGHLEFLPPTINFGTRPTLPVLTSPTSTQLLAVLTDLTDLTVLLCTTLFTASIARCIPTRILILRPYCTSPQGILQRRF